MEVDQQESKDPSNVKNALIGTNIVFSNSLDSLKSWNYGGKRQTIADNNKDMENLK